MKIAVSGAGMVENAIVMDLASGHQVTVFAVNDFFPVEHKTSSH